MAALQTAKKELRKRIRTVLSELSAESISSQSSTATRTLLSLPEYKSAKQLSIYLSMPSGEISTAAIVRDAFQNGKQVYVPYLHRTDPTTASGRASVMEMLALNSLEDYESLQRDKWGIPTLDAASVSTRKNCLGGNGIPDPEGIEGGGSSAAMASTEPGLDFIVMPGVAFDEGLRRLGHGKGYYDHFLMRCGFKIDAEGRKVGQRPYLAALALKEQILPPGEKVPTTAHDYPVDAVAVGDGRILTMNE